MITPLFFVLIALVAGQVLSPACYDSCILSSCTDITHLNCVCSNEANTIHLCVLASCDATDQILAQQAQAAVCGNSTSSSSANLATASKTSSSSNASQFSASPTSVSGPLSPTASLTSTPSSALSSQIVPPNSIVPTPTETSTSSDGLSAAAKGGIAGGVVGGVVLFASLIGLVFFMKTRKARKQELTNVPVPSYEEKKETEPVNMVALRYPEDGGEPEELGGRLQTESGVRPA